MACFSKPAEAPREAIDEICQLAIRQSAIDVSVSLRKRAEKSSAPSTTSIARPRPIRPIVDHGIAQAQHDFGHLGLWICVLQ